MSFVKISPTLLPYGSIRDAVDKSNAELLTVRELARLLRSSALVRCVTRLGLCLRARHLIKMLIPDSTLLQFLLGNKAIAAHLDMYLEDVNKSDGYTALLCAVQNGDLASARLVR